MVPWPTQYLHLKVKTDNLDGLKGVKSACPTRTHRTCGAAVGMAPVLIPWGETIPALASGAVAGVSTSSVSGVDGKFWEFLKYVYPTNHTWSCQMVNVNNDTWKKFSARAPEGDRRTGEETRARASGRLRSRPTPTA
jgi:TRAP-type C4-dicarboxylate transport system substrate-binding protein